MSQPGPGGPVANVIIAGVNKAGTTSLFVSLSQHPEVRPASVKETRYFLAPRWGDPLEPRAVYESYFTGSERPLRLEATPSYFYGGRPVIDAMQDVCGPDLRVVVALREPVARLVSFFTSQQARLRLPARMTIEEYVETADRMTEAELRDPQSEKWFGVRGGRYADFLPAWQDAFGERLHVLFFEELMAEPDGVLAGVADFLGVDARGLADGSLSSENRTMAFRNRALQRVALAANTRFERFLRRHYGLKERLRRAYYRVNGRPSKDSVSAATRQHLEARYQEPNLRLAGLLRARSSGALPDWLSGAAVSPP